MPLTRDELQSIAASVGERAGWDFSRLRDDRDATPWDYANVARQYLFRQHRVLDIGTGGAEVFLSLSDRFGDGVAIDAFPSMIADARQNVDWQKVANVSLVHMRAERLGFGSESMDVVLNRHAPTFPREVEYVLRAKGVFVTQQVGERNTQNIYDAFGWGSLGEQWREYERSRGQEPQDVNTVSEAFQALGYEVLDRQTYDVPYFYRDIESLVFALKSLPYPEDFDVDRHYRVVSAFVDANTTSRGIHTNEHRELLVVKKPANG